MKLTLNAIKSLFRKYDRKMQRGIDGVKAYVDESVADWNQSDETAPDFVKNRTHYEYTERNKVLTITIPAAPIVETGDYAYNFRNGELNNYKGKRGDTVLVVFDGVEYYCTQVGDFNDSSTNYGYVIGNTSIVDDGGGMGDGIGQMPEIDTGEPFAIWNQSYYMSNSGIVLRDGNEHTIEVYELKKYVKPLDEKYIPDSIARKSDIPQGGGTSDIPDTLPNPHPLTFTGAVEATYDGSTPVEVEIPMGGSGGGEAWDVMANFKAEEDVSNFLQTIPPEGHSFSEYTELIVLLYVKPNSAGKTSYIKLGIEYQQGYNGFFRFATGGIKDTTKKGRIEILHVRKTDAGWIPVFGGRSYNEDSMNNGIQFMPNLGYDVLTLNKQPNADPEDISTVMQTKDMKLIAIGGYETVLGAGSMAIVYGKRGA